MSLLLTLVVRRDERIVVISSSVATTGMGVFNGWFRTAAADCSDLELGELVARSLERSAQSEDFEPPAIGRNGDRLQPVYDDLGVGDAKQFGAGASAVSVEADEDGVYATPMLNDGRRGGGFVAYGEELTLDRDVSALELGACVRSALEVLDLPDHRSGPSHT